VTRTVFAFMLAELNTVRICCQNPECQAVLELPLAQLAKKTEVRCRWCNADFDPTHTEKSALSVFAQNVIKIQELAKIVQLEFVFPGDGESGSSSGQK
jgi:hypothetical protein